jgi:DNA polymerase-3 subunit epsilon
MRGWRRLFGAGEPSDDRLARIASQRWVVVDLETSGLDPARDTVLAIGGAAVCAQRVRVEDSFERVVRPAHPSDRANILVHGIGEGMQRAGTDPALACGDFLRWCAGAPLVAFHASFDRAFLTRALARLPGRSPRLDWLDLAALAPALNPRVRAHALDEWLDHFGLEAGQRHHASADAFATAMLFVRLMAQVPPRERDLDGLQRLARAQRWAG